MYNIHDLVRRNKLIQLRTELNKFPSNIDSKDYGGDGIGYTALYLACQYGNKDAAVLLMAIGQEEDTAICCLLTIDS